jgi:hypothetical protein
LIHSYTAPLGTRNQRWKQEEVRDKTARSIFTQIQIIPSSSYLRIMDYSLYIKLLGAVKNLDYLRYEDLGLYPLFDVNPGKG